MYSFPILPRSLRLSLIDDDINMKMNKNRKLVCVGITINTCHILKWPQLVLQQDEWVTMAGIYASIIVHVWLMFLALYLRRIFVIHIWLIVLLTTLPTQLYVILLTCGKTLAWRHHFTKRRCFEHITKYNPATFYWKTFTRKGSGHL